MRFITRVIVLFVAIVAFCELFLFLFTRRDYSSPRDTSLSHGNQEELLRQKTIMASKSDERRQEDIHVAVVSCGDRMEEATNMLKSITLFTKRQLKFHILAEDQQHDGIRSSVNQWLPVKKGHVKYKLYPLSFPEGKSKADWKKLFKPCASQRLFLPTVLSNVDSLIYFDTDSVVLRPIEHIWDHFKQFNSSQLAAVAPEGEVPALNWYSRFAMHPFYGKLGINSGVMLMNLTRMRAFKMEEQIASIYLKYKLKITWGDQDLLNILFHFHPELLYILGCEWNYRPDHCMYGNNCERADIHGISVLHGNRQAFHAKKNHPAFKAVYDALSKFHHGGDALASIKSLTAKLDTLGSSYCGKMKNAILKHPLKYIKSQK